MKGTKAAGIANVDEAMKNITTYKTAITRIVENITEEALLKRIYQFVAYLYLRHNR